MFASMPLSFRGQTACFKLAETVNWAATIKRGKFSNYKNAFSLIGDSEEPSFLRDYTRDACRVRHPATPMCESFCAKIFSDDITKNLPQTFSKSLIMSRVEFLMSLLGVQFVVVNNIYDQGRQLRILSTSLKSVIPGGQDVDHLFGADISEDILGAFQAYARSSYFDVKNDPSFNFQKDQIIKSDFFDSAEFDYFCKLGFAVDAVADEAMFTSLEHDKNVPDGILDRSGSAGSAAASFTNNKASSRNDAALMRLDSQISRLLKSIERLSAYRDVSESCHFGVLCLLRKFLNTWIGEERARIAKSLELTAAEKDVLTSSGSATHVEREAMLQLHEHIKQTAATNYRLYLATLLKRLSNVYMEFMSTAGGVSTRRRIDFVLKFPETRSDEFLQVRKKQFRYLLNQTERAAERFDLALYMKKFPPCVSSPCRQLAH